MKPMNALVVDDHKQMRSLVSKMLQRLNKFEVIAEAEDGEYAWDRLESAEKPFDIVICDIKMEKLDGVSLLKRCREHPKYKLLPFLMISGDADQAFVAATVGEWGASAFIVKPFSANTLTSRLETIFQSMNDKNTQVLKQVEKLRQEGHQSDALGILEEAERQSKLSLAKMINAKGECLLEMGDFNQASKEFERAMKLNNIFIAAYKNFSSAQIEMGNTSKALEALEHVDYISPIDPDRAVLIGDLSIKSGDVEKGKEYIGKGLKRCNSNQRGELLNKIAAVYDQHKMYGELEQVYAAMLKSNNSAETFNKLGIALRQQRKYASAERCYLEALGVHPDNPIIMYNLAILYVSKNDLSNAIKYLTKSLTVKPDFTDALSLLEKVERKFHAGRAQAQQVSPLREALAHF